MTISREDVVQRSHDGLARIVRRRYLSGFKDYVVERFVSNDWIRSKNGPWDYLVNARNELGSDAAT